MTHNMCNMSHVTCHSDMSPFYNFFYFYYYYIYIFLDKLVELVSVGSVINGGLYRLLIFWGEGDRGLFKKGKWLKKCIDR